MRWIEKAAHPTVVVSEMMIADDWRKSILVSVYKGKGDPLVCGSYRTIKLQPMKVLERVLEKKIRCQVSIDNMQFGFMFNKGTLILFYSTNNGATW